MNIQIIADPTIDRNQTSFPSSSTTAIQSQLAQPVSDPANSSTSTAETAVSTQPFYLPSVPDFTQETLFATAQTSQSGKFISMMPAKHSLSCIYSNSELRVCCVMCRLKCSLLIKSSERCSFQYVEKRLFAKLLYYSVKLLRG